MKYKIINNVNLRKTPVITAFNYAGRYLTGRIVDVIDTSVDEKNRLWARITEPDSSGRSIYFCIKTVSKTFAEQLDPIVDTQNRVDAKYIVAKLEEIIVLLRGEL